MALWIREGSELWIRKWGWRIGKKISAYVCICVCTCVLAVWHVKKVKWKKEVENIFYLYVHSPPSVIYYAIVKEYRKLPNSSSTQLQANCLVLSRRGEKAGGKWEYEKGNFPWKTRIRGFPAWTNFLSDSHLPFSSKRLWSLVNLKLSTCCFSSHLRFFYPEPSWIFISVVSENTEVF